MNNDFDFIKDKLEKSGVTAPEDMGEEFALKAIENIEPKPVALPKKPRKKIAAIVAAAASFVLVCAVGTAIGINLSKKSNTSNTLEVPGGLTLRTFSDRAEVEDTVKALVAKNEFSHLFKAGSANGAVADEFIDYETSDSAGSAELGGTSSDSPHSETYKQVEGVDEADIIKTDGRYIYSVDSYSMDTVNVFEAKPGSEKPVAAVNIRKGTVASPDEAERDFDYESYYMRDSFWISEIYLSDGRMTVMCNGYDGGNITTSAYVYDVSDVNNITLLDTMTQSGSYVSSRMIGSTLYTVSSYCPNERNLIPLCGGGDSPAEIPCDCIYSYEKPAIENFLVVSVYDTESFGSEDIMSKAILGAAEDIYCNLDNLYIYSTTYGSYNGFDEWTYKPENISSQILKVSLSDGLKFTAFTELPGVIDDQYALDEYNGNLRVATTSISAINVDTNNLYVLDSNLSMIGSVTGFAENESIKAVRYLGDTAYVITYEQTDPLFVIDLSDPTAPKILGEAKITGFSTMLVPVDENTILGIGVYTQNEDYTSMEVQEGVKLALFDVSDKSNPTVLDSLSFKNFYSPVTYNPRALVFNPERGDFVIPLNYIDYYGGSYDEESYGGMLNFKVENGKLVVVSRYEAPYPDEIERCVFVGDTVYMIHNGDEGQRLDSAEYQK